MKKFLLPLLLSFMPLMLPAQTLRLQVSPALPAASSEVLTQRFTQMLAAGGYTVSTDADAPVVCVDVEEKDRVEAGGVALVLDVTASVKDVSAVFTVRGVGEDVEDATLRACKQILPRSKASQAFLSRVREVVK